MAASSTSAAAAVKRWSSCSCGVRCLALGVSGAAAIRSAAAAFVGRPATEVVTTAATALRFASSGAAISDRHGGLRTATPYTATSGLWSAVPVSSVAAVCGAAALGRRRRFNSGRASAVAMKAEGEDIDAPQSDISQIDFRVGLIVSAKTHPDSEKLLVEEIDVGEGEPRTICSGIAPWFSPDEVQGKRCVVVANLKERKLAGVPSNGMLLCAKEITEGDEAGALDIVEAPGSAEIGERIVIEVEGEAHGEAAPPNRVAKKKLYEKVANEFCTNADGTVCYKDMPFMTSAGPCTATKIPKGVVS